MRKTFASLAVVLMLMPAVSFGATPQELESQRIDLLKQLVVLLEARVQQLVKLLEAKNGQVLGAATSTVSTTTSTNSASSTEVVKKKRRGGGGGGGGSRRNETSTTTIPETHGGQLVFSVASDSPDRTGFIVDSATATRDFTLLVYDMEAKNTDIKLNKLFIELVSGRADIDHVVSAVGLTINGEYYDLTQAIFFEDEPKIAELVYELEGGLVIPKDNVATVELYVEFHPQGDNYEIGETIQARVTPELVDATVATDNELLLADDLRGEAEGAVHTLLVPGVFVDLESVETTTDIIGADDSVGAFTIEFEVTAIEGDFYINNFASTEASTTIGGVQFRIDGASSTTSPTDIVSTLTSSADESDAGAFVVKDGETEVFTLNVNLSTPVTNQYRIVLEELWYSSIANGGNGSAWYPLAPESDFSTGYLTVNSSNSSAPTPAPEPQEEIVATSTDVESEEVGLVVSNAVSTFSTPDAYAIANGFEGVIWLNFDVTAVGADAYIANWITKGNSVAGIEYEFEAQSGSGTPLAFIWSTVDTAGDVPHHIKEGTTETFTLEVFVNATEEGDFKITLSGVNYSQNPDGITNAVEVTPSPSSEFDSDWHHVSAS